MEAAVIGQRYLTAFAVFRYWIQGKRLRVRVATETNFNTWPKKFDPSLCNAKLPRRSFLC
jgi:hypothetical protein